MTEATMQNGYGSGLGQWLLQSREAKGVSLEEAADITRISKAYIDALEKEDFDRLPGPAYCKGFLRIYAGYLGISADEAVARYDMKMSGGAAPVRPPADENPVPQAQKTGRRWVLPVILLSLVLLVSIFVDTNPRPPVNRPAVKPETAQTSRPAPVQPQPSSSKPAAAPVAAPVQQTNEAPVSAAPVAEPQKEGLILKLKVNQDSWLNVDIDGRLSKQYDLKAGDLIEWKADSLITIDIGNAGGVEGEVNGKPLAPFGAAGKKAHVVIRPEGASIQ
ncbi:cytoskeletal protein RodZ [Geobacter sp. OR-1]|uniref:helix-turn-helix domain-containing protein n=1 Tax=Geobacter sp. OR-1 TaxID=1266765 RepID=UPI0005430E0F|nr:helix-turn-helix domain-containing protein [Geobacter sp. OR-1]GAM11686.1 cytoskeletal protein RodZ [Geobacter sp. OR-1]